MSSLRVMSLMMVAFLAEACHKGWTSVRTPRTSACTKELTCTPKEELRKNSRMYFFCTKAI
jgi:hypothetical protein